MAGLWSPISTPRADASGVDSFATVVLALKREIGVHASPDGPKGARVDCLLRSQQRRQRADTASRADPAGASGAGSADIAIFGNLKGDGAQVSSGHDAGRAKRKPGSADLRPADVLPYDFGVPVFAPLWELGGPTPSNGKASKYGGAVDTVVDHTASSEGLEERFSATLAALKGELASPRRSSIRSPLREAGQRPVGARSVDRSATSAGHSGGGKVDSDTVVRQREPEQAASGPHAAVTRPTPEESSPAAAARSAVRSSSRSTSRAVSRGGPRAATTTAQQSRAARIAAERARIQRRQAEEARIRAEALERFGRRHRR